MGNTDIPLADSFQYLAKLIQYCKFKNKIKFKLPTVTKKKRKKGPRPTSKWVKHKRNCIGVKIYTCTYQFKNHSNTLKDAQHH